MRSRPEHVPSLDILRGFLALAVAVYHFQSWTHVFSPALAASNTVAVLGIYAVQGFFIISGFCFFHLYADTRFDPLSLKHFYIKRFMRIAPLFYFALALNVVLAQPVGPMPWQRVLENLTLTFGLFHPNHARVLGGWSVGLEVVFYLAFPLLARLLRARVALYLAALGLMVLAYGHELGDPSGVSPWVRFHAYVQLPNHAFLFLLGGVVADVRRHVKLRIVSSALFAALVLVVVISAQRQTPFYDHFEVMTGMARAQHLTACFVVVLLVALHDFREGHLSRPMRWLGDHSYSVYLIHPFASLAATSLISLKRSPWLAFGVGLMLTIVFSAITRYLVEQPAIRWGKHLTRAQPVPERAQDEPRWLSQSAE